MPLTPSERDFLSSYVYEATHAPFRGPATSDLHERGIHYSDLNWILTAFDRELCDQEIPPVGHQNANTPPSPWAELAKAKLRNQELREELECQVAESANGQFAVPATWGQSQGNTMAASKG